MTNIRIGTETEGSNHWQYEVTVEDGGADYHFVVRLSWVDYDLWSHGRVAPERVVRAAFEFLLQNEPVTQIMQKFDCSVIRRYFPQVDQELPGLI